MLTQMLPQRPLATHQLNFVHNFMIFELIPTLNWTFEQISFSSFNTLWFTFRIETSKRNCEIWWNNSSLCNKAAKTMQNHWEILNWNLTLPDLIIQIQEKNCRCIFLPKMERIKCMPFFSCILHPITTKIARKKPKIGTFFTQPRHKNKWSKVLSSRRQDCTVWASSQDVQHGRSAARQDRRKIQSHKFRGVMLRLQLKIKIKTAAA